MPKARILKRYLSRSDTGETGPGTICDRAPPSVRLPSLLAALLFSALLLAFPHHANAIVSPQPGDACAAGQVGTYATNVGALQIPGYFLVCDGTTWNLFESFTAAGNVGIGGTTPATRLDVAGTLRVANGGESCSSTVKGGIRYTSTNLLQYCNSTIWKTISASGSISAAGTQGNIQFNSGGVLAAASTLTYTSAGRLGIGTTSPSNALLEVDQTTASPQPAIRGYAFNNNGIVIGVEGFSSRNGGNPGAQVGVMGMQENGVSQGAGGWFGIGATEGSTTIPSYLSTRSISAALIADNLNSTAPIFVGLSNSSAVFEINSAGNVGIGTTTPLGPLHVIGTSGNLLFTSAGSLGIGTTTPDNTLEVIGGASIAASGSSTFNAGNIQLQDSNNSNYWQITNRGSSDTGNRNKLLFNYYNGSGWAPEMTLSTSGFLGIGTTSPASMLSVGASNQFQVTSGGNVTWAETVAPSVGIAAHTSDLATNALTISGQNAYASASTNVNGGGVVIQGGQYTSNAWSTTNGVMLKPNLVIPDALEVRNMGYQAGPLLYATNNGSISGMGLATNLLCIGLGGGSGHSGGCSTNDFGNEGWLKIISSTAATRILTGDDAPLTIKSGSGNPGGSGSAQNAAILTLQGGDATTSTNAGIPAVAGTGGSIYLHGGLGGLSQSGAVEGNGGNVYIYGGELTVGGAGGTVGNVLLADDGTNPTGAVGIGTTAPATKLDVAGTARISDGGETCSATIKGGIRYTSTNILQYCNASIWKTLSASGSASAAGTQGNIQFNSGGVLAATSTLTYNTTTGNVGIGTTSPAVSLEVNGGTGIKIDNVTSPTVDLDTNGTGGGGHLNFSVAGTNRIALLETGGSHFGIWGSGHFFTMQESNGNIGINDDSAGTKLSVVGNAQIGYSSGQTGPANGLIVSGKVGIGTTSPGELLYVSGGNISATGVYKIAATQVLALPDADTASIAVGNGALAAQSATGSDNTAVGSQALHKDNSGNLNTAVGYGALQNTTTGAGNVALGYLAGTGNTTGTGHTAIGYDALNSTTGAPNTVLGYYAGIQITTGSDNIAIGANAMDSSGLNPLTAANAGNIAIGDNALTKIVGGAAGNVAVGYNALTKSTVSSTSPNTALGYEAGFALVSGTDNTLIGYEAGLAVTGSHNIILGEDPSSAITSGGSNILVGNSLSYVTNTASSQLDIGDVVTGTVGGTGKIGIGIGAATAPATRLQINGTAMVADGGETCSSTVAGGIRYTSAKLLQYCNATSW